MKRVFSFPYAALLKIAIFAAVFFAGYWFLEHWDDFKAGLRGDPPAKNGR